MTGSLITLRTVLLRSMPITPPSVVETGGTDINSISQLQTALTALGGAGGAVFNITPSAGLGGLTLTNLVFPSGNPVIIRAKVPFQSRISYLDFVGTTRGIIVQNMNIWPDNGQGPPSGAIVNHRSTSSYTETWNCDIRSRADADDYINWSHQKWLDNKYAGVVVDGSFGALRGGRVRGMNMAVELHGNGNQMGAYNGVYIWIDGCSGDFFRPHGNDITVDGFVLANGFQLDDNQNNRIDTSANPDNGDNHADASQHFGTHSNVIQRNGYIAECIESTEAPSRIDLPLMTRSLFPTIDQYNSAPNRALRPPIMNLQGACGFSDNNTSNRTNFTIENIDLSISGGDGLSWYRTNGLILKDNRLVHSYSFSINSWPFIYMEGGTVTGTRIVTGNTAKTAQANYGGGSVGATMSGNTQLTTQGAHDALRATIYSEIPTPAF